MTKRWPAALILATLLGGCGDVELRLGKSAPGPGEDMRVTARVAGAKDGTSVQFRIAGGQECGTVPAPPAQTSNEIAFVTFTSSKDVEECRTTIEAVVSGKTAKASFFVNPLPITKLKLDGVSLVALFAVGSFVVDRVVRALLFLLAFIPGWRRLAGSDGDGATENDKRRQKLAYAVLASLLAVVALGWFGRIRLLTALGFAQVHPAVDALFTGLLMVAGAERIESLLQMAGVGGAESKPTAPIEITGKLVLEEPAGKKSETRAASAG